MQSRIFSLLFFVTLVFSACSSRKPVAPVAAAAETVVVTGQFKSVQGVMDQLSCYTSNGGYITQASGERVAVSFTSEAEITCATIEVKGHYITKTISGDANNPCPAGTMKMLEVESYMCK
ncbi:MAG: hypothetical protein ACK5Z2_15865 [Bacteroidota bacterium]